MEQEEIQFLDMMYQEAVGDFDMIINSTNKEMEKINEQINKNGLNEMYAGVHSNLGDLLTSIYDAAQYTKEICELLLKEFICWKAKKDKEDNEKNNNDKIC